MFHLSIVTPEKVVLDEEVTSLIAPGSEGYLEILTGHAPIAATLKTGRVTVTAKDGKKSIFAISGGLLEVSFNNANLLAAAVEPAGTIDLKRAEQAFARAQKRLASDDKEIILPRAKASLQRAQNRISIAKDK